MAYRSLCVSLKSHRFAFSESEEPDLLLMDAKRVSDSVRGCRLHCERELQFDVRPEVRHQFRA